MKNKILLIGSGGRESAILSAILKSNLLGVCYFAHGISQVFYNPKLQIIDIDISNHSAVVTFCKEKGIDFVIVGPETPLCDGIVDVLEQNHIAVYGANRAASMLEGSKIFMKDVIQSAGVPTAKYETFTHEQLSQARAFIQTFTGKIVIKTDGLASGKGVYICENHTDANAVLIEFFNGKFGDAGKSVVIEEFLEGREVSIFALCDGNRAIPFFHACDYKKIGNGDVGLNTGGMGSFAPSFLSDDKFRSIVNQYFNATLDELKRRGIIYKGFLFGGLIITEQGVKFLEYNIRMGDPETKSIMPLLDCDLLKVLLQSYNGTLTEAEIKFQKKHTVTVVLASNGYPLEFEKHKKIDGLRDVLCNIYPSGLYEKQSKFFTNGGRVASITAIGNSQEEARTLVYQNVKKISFDGIYYRDDIAQ